MRRNYPSRKVSRTRYGTIQTEWLLWTLQQRTFYESTGTFQVGFESVGEIDGGEEVDNLSNNETNRTVQIDGSDDGWESAGSGTSESFGAAVYRFNAKKLEGTTARDPLTKIIMNNDAMSMALTGLGQAVFDLMRLSKQDSRDAYAWLALSSDLIDGVAKEAREWESRSRCLSGVKNVSWVRRVVTAAHKFALNDTSSINKEGNSKFGVGEDATSRCRSGAQGHLLNGPRSSREKQVYWERWSHKRKKQVATRLAESDPSSMEDVSQLDVESDADISANSSLPTGAETTVQYLGSFVEKQIARSGTAILVGSKLTSSLQNISFKNTTTLRNEDDDDHEDLRAGILRPYTPATTARLARFVLRRKWLRQMAQRRFNVAGELRECSQWATNYLRPDLHAEVVLPRISSHTEPFVHGGASDNNTGPGNNEGDFQDLVGPPNPQRNASVDGDKHISPSNKPKQSLRSLSIGTQKNRTEQSPKQSFSMVGLKKKALVISEEEHPRKIIPGATQRGTQRENHAPRHPPQRVPRRAGRSRLEPNRSRTSIASIRSPPQAARIEPERAFASRVTALSISLDRNFIQATLDMQRAICLFNVSRIQSDRSRLDDSWLHPIPWPLGYVPSRAETLARAEYPFQTIAPDSIGKIVNSSGRLSSADWFSPDPTGMVSCDLTGAVCIWDMTRTLSTSGPQYEVCHLTKPLFVTECQGPAFYVTSQNKMSGTTILACCDAAAAPVNVLDLRVGSFVSSFFRGNNRTSISAHQDRQAPSSLYRHITVAGGAVTCAVCPTNPTIIAVGFVDGGVSLFDLRRGGGDELVYCDSFRPVPNDVSLQADSYFEFSHATSESRLAELQRQLGSDNEAAIPNVNVPANAANGVHLTRNGASNLDNQNLIWEDVMRADDESSVVKTKKLCRMASSGTRFAASKCETSLRKAYFPGSPQEPFSKRRIWQSAAEPRWEQNRFLELCSTLPGTTLHAARTIASDTAGYTSTGLSNATFVGRSADITRREQAGTSERIAHVGPVSQLKFLPKSTFLVSASLGHGSLARTIAVGDPIRIWDWMHGCQVVNHQFEVPETLAFSAETYRQKQSADLLLPLPEATTGLTVLQDSGSSGRYSVHDVARTEENFFPMNITKKSEMSILAPFGSGLAQWSLQTGALTRFVPHPSHNVPINHFLMQSDDFFSYTPMQCVSGDVSGNIALWRLDETEDFIG